MNHTSQHTSHIFCSHLEVKPQNDTPNTEDLSARASQTGYVSVWDVSDTRDM